MQVRKRSIILSVLFISLVLLVQPGTAAEKAATAKIPPYTHYWVDVATQNMTMPGMSEGMGGFMGKIMGGPGFGPSRSLLLLVNSPMKLPADPNATHDIPPGQNMGKTLPLMIPEKEKVERYEPGERHEEREHEKPRFRMLIYWGCSDEVRKGQPRVLDTEKMNPAEFGRAMSGIRATQQYPPSPRSGWIFADWPNKKSRIEVPKDSSLTGDHFVHGNYVPDIRFAVGPRHDFMAPVEFTSTSGTLADPVRFDWREIPTAIGYYAYAMGNNDREGEMIIWSSSEIPDASFGLMDYLTPGDVQKFIKEKIVMPPGTTTCTIPRGIFKDTGGPMLQFIGYGDELNLIHPPKPKDPKQPWNPIWSVKMRLKSTGMLMLGQSDERKPSRSRDQKGQESGEQDQRTRKQEQERKPEEKQPGVDKTIDKIRGIFGF